MTERTTPTTARPDPMHCVLAVVTSVAAVLMPVLGAAAGIGLIVLGGARRMAWLVVVGVAAIALAFYVYAVYDRPFGFL